MKNRFVFVLAAASALVGCAGMNNKQPPIQRRGDVVAQGAGMLSFRAPGPGLVSLYDVNTNSVVQSTAVEAGSVVSTNPQAGNVTVTDATRSGTQIVHTGVEKSHRYEMWFIPRTYTPQDAATTMPLRY
jgi:hypothetical protein